METFRSRGMCQRPSRFPYSVEPGPTVPHTLVNHRHRADRLVVPSRRERNSRCCVLLGVMYTAAESFLKYWYSRALPCITNVRTHTRVAGRVLILAEFNLAIFSCTPNRQIKIPSTFSRYTVIIVALYFLPGQ